MKLRNAAAEYAQSNGVMPNCKFDTLKESHKTAFIKGAEWQRKQALIDKRTSPFQTKGLQTINN